MTTKPFRAWTGPARRRTTAAPWSVSIPARKHASRFDPMDPDPDAGWEFEPRLSWARRFWNWLKRTFWP